MPKYFSLETQKDEADIVIYGDITSWPWLESDVSAYNLSEQIRGLDVGSINVHLSSYGGEVSEGLAIYNALKQHPAKIKTYCDGFACSIASVIFMAGEERVMSNASLLMIHNPWTYTHGNAQELRKTAEDLDKMSQASVNAYMEYASITEAEVKALMDEETWITPQEALDYGLATAITKAAGQEKYSQSVRRAVMEKLTKEKTLPGTLVAPAQNKQKTLLDLFRGMAPERR